MNDETINNSTTATDTSNNNTAATDTSNNSPASMCNPQDTALDLHLSPHWKKNPLQYNTALENIWLWGQTATDLYFSFDPYQELLNNVSNICKLGLLSYKMGIVIPPSLNGLMCVVL